MSTADAVCNKDLKEIIRNLVPTWFAVNMGTGSISVLLHAFPYGNGTMIMNSLSLTFFIINLLLFTLLSAISLTRYILFPDVWNLTVHHPVQSLCLGYYPMGAASLINIAVDLIFRDYEFGGRSFLYMLWLIWWLDVVISVVCCWVIVHIMITRQSHSLSKMTPVWLIPAATLIKASSTGGVLARPLQQFSALHALVTLSLSVFMVTIGLSLVFMILTLYVLRLIVHGLPPGRTVLSVFLPIGPAAQAGYTFLLIGQSSRSLHFGNLELSISNSTEIINVICVCCAFMMWSLAVMWVIFALFAVQEVLRETRFPFRVSHWGLIFPIGVFANLTIQLARILNAPFFRVLGAVFAVVTLLLWTYTATRTMMLVWNTSIFEAPGLEDMSKLPASEKEVQKVGRVLDAEELV